MPSSEFLLGHSLQAFAEDGSLKDKAVVKELDGLFKDFLQFITISEQLNNASEINKQKVTNFSWDKD